jgi:hypothetical protein
MNPRRRSAISRWSRCALRPCGQRSIPRPRIFLCYRRDDAPTHTAWLASLLVKRFGREMVFQDIDRIVPGEDYRDAIRRELDSCGWVLPIIGQRWLTVTDDEGRRRIDYPNDPVREEIELALQADARVRIIPILIDGAKMPRSSELPEPMARLAYRQAHELTARHFNDDADALIARIVTPRHDRFGSWGDIRRTAPVWALVVHAMWRPIWPNVLLPALLVLAGLLLPYLPGSWGDRAPLLIPVAVALYVVLAVITLFDLQQARCVHECLEELERGDGASRLRAHERGTR